MAVLGVGNELNGDDAAGVAVVRRLRMCLPPRPQVLLLEGGAAPENFTGVLRRFAPHWVVLVDAAQMGEAPGCILWLDWRDAEGMSASTHTLPPTVLAEYLIHELGCGVGLLGIQPQQLEFDEAMSAPVRKAVRLAANGLARLLDGSRQTPNKNS